MIISSLWIASALAADVVLSPGDDVASKTAVLNAGDNVFFGDGVFEIASDLYWTGAGTADAPIRLTKAEGADPILRITGGYFLIHVDAATFLTIEGITLAGAEGWEENGWNGITMSGSSDITLKDLELRNLGAGIDIGDGSRISITGTEIHDITGEAIDAGCGDASCWLADSTIQGNWIHDLVGENQTAIGLDHGGQGNLIADNVIHDTLYHGIYAGSTEFGPQNTVRGNAVFDVGGSGLVIEGSALVQNNIVFRAGDYGIYVSDTDRNTLQDVAISFNTVAETGQWGAWLRDWPGHTGMVFANNVIANPLGYGMDYDRDDYTAADPSNQLAGNLVTGLVEDMDIEVHPTGALPGAGYADFLDAPNGNFYPVRDSLLVNAADPAGENYVPTDDFNGAVRQGDVPDVGAYEWTAEANPGWTIEPGFKVLGVTEVTGGADVGGGCCGKDGTGEAGFGLLPLAGLLWLRRRRAACT